jgi:ATP-dependent DNA helicase DinG
VTSTEPTEPDPEQAPSVTREEMHDALDRLLTKVVQNATGDPNALPRPGQLALSHDVLDAMIGSAGTVSWTRGQVAGNAPTGVGKSFAVLCAACVISWARRERVVISTESLGLQGQYVDKDAPVVQLATAEVLGHLPVVAVHKGWSNTVCGARAAAAAGDALGLEGIDNPDQLAKAMGTLEERREASAAGAAPAAPVGALFSSASFLGAAGDMVIDGRPVRERDGLPLISWAVQQVHRAEQGMDVPGDRQSYEGSDPDGYWSLVSTSPDGCPGTDKCSFGRRCLPTAARKRAADADIIITNHSMLALQAALNVPVVLGSRRLGMFRHLIVDEAHALPGQVRSMGARKVDAWRIQRVVKSTANLLDPHADDPDGKKVLALNSAGMDLADQLDSRLTNILNATGRSESVVKQGEAAFPLQGLDQAIVDWAKQVRSFYPDEERLINMREILAVRRANALVDSLLADVKGAAEYEKGVARWVEQAPRPARGAGQARFIGTSLNTSPVEIGGRLNHNLYAADVLPPKADEDPVDPDAVGTPWVLPPSQWVDPYEVDQPRHDLSVAMVSATLPRSFTFEMGLRTRLADYPSPFDSAYDNSVLFIPRARDQADIEALTSARWGKKKFDPDLFPQWAVVRMIRYIQANQGSTLVLAARSRDGQLYAERLRAAFAGRWSVYSQWDGSSIRQITTAWKNDHHSVLVGTKSLMTGVDAPGQTNSLVIIDRPARAASNPVDDARVELVMERQEIDKWAADRQVYVADAAALMEQQAGRLIRSLSDFGAVVCLDPRLLKSSLSLKYQEPTRAAYMEAFRRFHRKTAEEDELVKFLEASAASSLHLAGT